MKVSEELKNEKIIFESKAHWMLFVSKGTIAGLFFLFAFFNYLSSNEIGAAVTSLVIAALFIGLRIADVKSTRLILTDKRLWGRTGILRVKKLSVPVDKVQYVNIDTSVIGGILGYSTIKINAITGTYKFKRQKNAEEMQNAIINIAT